MISIIIPTLNEEQALPSLLDAISRQGADHEVIVVDGGSEDRTVATALDRGVRTLLSPPGRGNGMCAGAKEAAGDRLVSDGLPQNSHREPQALAITAPNPHPSLPSSFS